MWNMGIQEKGTEFTFRMKYLNFPQPMLNEHVLWRISTVEQPARQYGQSCGWTPVLKCQQGARKCQLKRLE